LISAETRSEETPRSPEKNLAKVSRVLMTSAAETRVVPPPPLSTDEAFSVGFPFAGVAGRVFMRAIWGAELLEEWILTKSFSGERLQSAVMVKFGVRAGGWVFSLIAAVCCSLAAACLLPLFWESSLRHLVPFVFLLVISYFAVRFGSVAGVVGTIGAALVFEIFLFEPRFSLTISNPAARDHLISMVLAGICASELLGRRKPPPAYKP
jgi:hypothetical protein